MGTELCYDQQPEEMWTDESDCEDDNKRKRTFLMSHGHADYQELNRNSHYIQKS